MRPASDEPSAASGRAQAEMRSSFRGSGLLLSGRFIAIGLNFLVQVLAIRYFLREEFGSFSFALSVVAFATNLNLLGLARTMSRLGPLYAERGDSSRLLGSVLASCAAIAVVGGAFVVLARYLWTAHPHFLGADDLSAELLLLLVVLTPLNALDAVLEVLCAGFAGARAIFFRRHLMTPLLRLAAVVAVISFDGAIDSLAYAYIGAGLVGVLAYVVILRRAFAARGIGLAGGLAVPSATIFGMGWSMLLVDVAGVSFLHLPAIFLEHSHGSSAVAGLRAVAPLATLGLVVVNSVKLLFVPLATRTAERGGRDELSSLYWAGVSWIAVLTFPVFVVSTFLARQVVPLIFGERYADTAALASIMSAGFYLHAILSLSSLLLQALGDSRRMVVTAGWGIGVAVASNLVLVPSYGALGAAVATAISLLVGGSMNAWYLVRVGRILRPDAAALRPLAWLLGASLFLLATVTLGHPPTWLALTLVAASTVTVWLATRGSLALLETFPELARIPLARRVLA